MHKTWWDSVRTFFASKIFRTLAVISLALGVYTVIVHKIEPLLFEEDLNFATTISGFFGLTMSILMVYRTNGAYDRWWEGRKVWGQLVNECRNLVVKACTLSQAPVEETQALQALVAAFPPALRDHLRGIRTAGSIVPASVVHGPNYVAEKVFEKLQAWREAGKLNDFAFLALNEHARAFLDVCGVCERIQKTPLPLSHRALIPQMLSLYFLVLPWGIEYHQTAALLVVVLGYFLIGLELIADGLERPFGTEDDSLPLESLCEGIATATLEVVERQSRSIILKVPDVDTESALC
ncbi:MAG: bestrophin family ion channel [Vulcanimicrobiota bacterium]